MRHEKQFLLEEVQSQFAKSDSFVIVRYTALSANTANSFRTAIAHQGGNFEVIRKRMLLKAAKAIDVTLDLASLPGHIGVVFAGQDPIETTKLVVKFGEDTGTVQVVGGRFDGILYSGPEMEAISKLPSKDEMRSELLAVFEAPMAQTLAVMEALLSSVVYAIDNKCKQES